MATHDPNADAVIFADMLNHVNSTPLVELVVDEAFVRGFQDASVESKSRT